MATKNDLYTLRWHASKIREAASLEAAKAHGEDQHTLLTAMIGDGVKIPDQPKEPERPNPDAVGKKLLYYPDAVITRDKMRTRGKYAQGYPQGAIVHFTAGRSLNGDKDSERTVQGGIDNGFCFFVLSSTGQVFQPFRLDEWGYHAGTSAWKGLKGTVSDELVGIEVNCAGKLKRNSAGKWESWFGEVYPDDAVRTVKAKDNVEAGTYHRYTQAQEDSLIRLLLWLYRNNPKVFSLDLVLGHDSVAPKRKNDPGGSLSMTIPELQKLLKSKA